MDLSSICSGPRGKTVEGVEMRKSASSRSGLWEHTKTTRIRSVRVKSRPVAEAIGARGDVGRDRYEAKFSHESFPLSPWSRLHLPTCHQATTITALSPKVLFIAFAVTAALAKSLMRSSQTRYWIHNHRLSLHTPSLSALEIMSEYLIEFSIIAVSMHKQANKQG